MKFVWTAALAAALFLLIACGRITVNTGNDCNDCGSNGDTGSNSIEDHTWTDADGNPIHLYDYKGTAMVLGNAAGWCAPCREEAKGLQQIYDDYKDRNFTVIVLLTEDAAGNPATEQTAADWRDEFGLSYIVGIDPDWSLEQYFTEDGLPFSMILDRDLAIYYRSNGFDDEIFRARIQEVL